MQDAGIVSPFIGFVGLSIDVMKDGFAKASLPLRKDLLNSLGVAHGGVIATLLDSAAGAAAYSVLEQGQVALTSDLNIAYMKNVSADVLVCEAHVYHRGSGIFRVEATVNARDVTLAKANVSLVIRDARGR